MSTQPVTPSKNTKPVEPWRSRKGKRTLVRKHYGGKMPGKDQALWFHLGGVKRVDGNGPVEISDEQMKAMYKRFFGSDECPKDGSIRFARSTSMKRRQDAQGPTICIVTGATRFSEIFSVGVVEFPLYQVGVPAPNGTGINLIQAMKPQATN